MNQPNLIALTGGTTVGIATQDTWEGILASTLATIIILIANAALMAIRNYFRQRQQEAEAESIENLENLLAQRKSEIQEHNESLKEK